MVSGESHYFLGQRYRLNVMVQNTPARHLQRLPVFRQLGPPPRDSLLLAGGLSDVFHYSQIFHRSLFSLDKLYSHVILA